MKATASFQMPIESKFQSVKHVAFAMRLHAVIWFATKIQNNQRKCRRTGLNANLCATTFDTAYKMTWSTCHVNVIEYESEKENFWAFPKINIIKTTANSMRKKNISSVHIGKNHTDSKNSEKAYAAPGPFVV